MSHWNIVGNMKQDCKRKQSAIPSVALLWALLINRLSKNIGRIFFEHAYLLCVGFVEEAYMYKEGLEATQVFTGKRIL